MSCHMLARLKVPISPSSPSALSESIIMHAHHNSAVLTDEPLLVDETRAVHRVLFLDRRTQSCKTAATLVASGPYGNVVPVCVQVSQRSFSFIMQVGSISGMCMKELNLWAHSKL